MRLLCIALVSLCACGHIPAAEPDAPAAWRGRPSARLGGDRVTLLPSGDSFRIPKSWLDWNHRFHNNLHLSRRQLEEVRDGAGEWDREYGAVVNAVLPFDSCAAHLGGEGWGRDGVSFGDVQMRVYTGAFDPGAIRAGALASGRARAAQFFRSIEVDSATVGGWQMTRLQWLAWYGDYGGTAHVEVLVSQHDGRSTVVVFMYAFAPERQRDGDIVLNSFAWTG